MDTNTLDFITALQTVTTDPSIQAAFDSGLMFGATVAAVLWAISFIRLIIDDGKEEL